MTHDLRRYGFPVPRVIQPRLSMAQLRTPVADGVAELILERRRHHAFILTLAHELRQPLSALFSAIEILHDARRSPTLANAVEVIDRQAHRMNRLVEDLIESARWVQGKTLLRTQRVDLRGRIAEAVADAAEMISARSHQIVTSESPEPLWVDADPARLGQVLSNLLDNAIKFTEPGGRIELTACRAGQEIVVRITDSGRGLRTDELAHIFNLFSQVRPREGGGLGIGLSVVWQMVALHRGRIEVRSDGPSRGTEFTITLPSAAAPGELCHA